jgi:hypothetical protein
VPAWVIVLLRAIGIRRAADVVPVATRLGEAIADVIDGEPPGQPLPRAAEDHIRRQIDSATSHKVPAVACDKPPPGWHCTRERGHDGPCSAWPTPAPSGGGVLVIKAAPPRPPRMPAPPPRPPRKRKGETTE